MSKSGMRKREVALAAGGAVAVYGDEERVVVQLRQKVPSDVELLKASFKVALQLTRSEAAALAAELALASLAK